MQAKRNLTWRFVDSADLPTCVLEGIVGEDAGLDDLVPDIKGPARFDLSGVARINSTGVREWLRFVEAINGKGPHRLFRCSAPIVAQLNMIDNFRGSAKVESVIAPYYCEACGHELATEVTIENNTPKLPSPACAECGETMALDEMPARYFYFLSY
ncbi:MAG: hypothetical protein IPG96_04185 [Proteobacteria bacterium]|nr:hypothetical protein [Pseudomonadota bacterium]